MPMPPIDRCRVLTDNIGNFFEQQAPADLADTELVKGETVRKFRNMDCAFLGMTDEIDGTKLYV